MTRSGKSSKTKNKDGTVRDLEMLTRELIELSKDKTVDSSDRIDAANGAVKALDLKLYIDEKFTERPWLEINNKMYG